jgi:signal transduction histidine kinase
VTISKVATRAWRLAMAVAVLSFHTTAGYTQPPEAMLAPIEPETRELVALVNDAAQRVRAEGKAVLDEFRVEDSRWRRGATYVFVLDREGTMLVHPDPSLEGANQLDLEDINGKPITRGLIAAATASPASREGWYHYEWPVPGAILPRWKSSFVRLVEAPSGESYVVGAGMYNDRMERTFVVDLVRSAVEQIETHGQEAFPLLRDRTGPFIAKDAYVFVVDMEGVELVNPAFPNLEGRNLLDVTDTEDKYLVRAMLDVAEHHGSGWVDYMWPKPGESAATQKSTYVSKARLGDRWLLVGSGVYLADAPRDEQAAAKLTAAEVMALVREGAALLEDRGEEAYPQFRMRGSTWFPEETYFFVWTTDGTRVFHAADPSIEGQDASDEKDVLGRPYGTMFIDAAVSPSGEGWVHYMYPEPGGMFPVWKSTFVKRVRFPSGEDHLIGAGIYHMAMDREFIEDLVSSAASLIAKRGAAAFDALRDPTGPYVFMDTYVFVDTPDGVEVVNAAQPSLEGRNIMDLTDVNGKRLAREYIAAALSDGSAWVEYHWYRPGHNTPARKQAYVQRVRSGDAVYIVGSGLYVD